MNDNWDLDEMFDNDGMIITISFLVFAFISYSYIFTVYKYRQFYQNMKYVAKISWIIQSLDFISNIIVGFIICLVSFAYLLQSESIGDVVLNSFALTFILELDDLANLFESDEDALIEADWSHLGDEMNRILSDWEVGSFKRNIKIEKLVIIIAIILVFLSPLFILAALFLVVADFIWKDEEPNEIEEKLNDLYEKQKDE